jgi:hypothetical protein
MARMLLEWRAPVLVILSATKNLGTQRVRFFAALRMTLGDRFVSPRLMGC